MITYGPPLTPHLDYATSTIAHPSPHPSRPIPTQLLTPPPGVCWQPLHQVPWPASASYSEVVVAPKAERDEAAAARANNSSRGDHQQLDRSIQGEGGREHRGRHYSPTMLALATCP